MMRGRVRAAFGRQYEVVGADGRRFLCYPRGKRSSLACGDHVEFAPKGNDQGVIQRIVARTSLVYRSDAWKEKLIAANVSQVVLVTATEPGFSDELISRCICAAEDVAARTSRALCRPMSMTTERSSLSAFAMPDPALE